MSERFVHTESRSQLAKKGVKVLYCKYDELAVKRLGNELLTTAKALKFARHDFLNELQLILLYIDLGKIPEAKRKILDTTDNMRQMSMLEKLGLPETEIWLTTFAWNYNPFATTMTCDIVTGTRKTQDATVVAYLKRVFDQAVNAVDAGYEYETKVEVRASATDWCIAFTVKGNMTNMQPIPKAEGDMIVEEALSSHQWTFTIRGR
ncbi:Spo0B domain-containing protein [Sporosarcina soli]|uniref:Spo0B domain-containing protein n=1 Tax=Sporosarcina soli TaxID=334736 RepID=A0ABW0TNU2_9BACL